MKISARWLLAVVLFVFVALTLIFPEAGIAVVVKIPRLVGPFIPLILYGLVALSTLKYLWAPPPDAVQMDLDKQQMASLTLAGFSFTSLNLIISFFKTEIAHGDSGPEAILFYFSFALACFAASYMTLRYRTKNLFPFLSDGLIDSGFWSIILGFLFFFLGLPGLQRLSFVLLALLAFYMAYVTLHFYHHVRYARKILR